MTGRVMTPYQKRMSRFIWLGNAYIIAGCLALYFLNVGHIAWLILGSTLFLHFSLAIGLDAVYDSLRERLTAADAGDDR
jgi:hypothetical protein